MFLAKLAQQWGRLGGLLLFSAMLLIQVRMFFALDGRWISHCRWALITMLFLQFWVAYLVRRPLKQAAQGYMEWILPFFCAGLPFVLMMFPQWLYPLGWKHWPSFCEHWIWPVVNSFGGRENAFGLWIMAFGELITIWGMLSLRGNFSIATEVRDWVSTGPYRWIRHPLYSGEIMSVWGYALYWPSPWALGGALLFQVVQTWRAQLEENKLISVYPQYAKFQMETGRFVPLVYKFFKR
jgi:protein-S-isoprenylcysteine O-methyltransferase Ste14